MLLYVAKRLNCVCYSTRTINICSYFGDAPITTNLVLLQSKGRKANKHATVEKAE